MDGASVMYVMRVAVGLHLGSHTLLMLVVVLPTMQIINMELKLCCVLNAARECRICGWKLCRACGHAAEKISGTYVVKPLHDAASDHELSDKVSPKEIICLD